jgi:hypothetical protein
MRKLVLASLVALLVPTASFAQFQVGARLGFAPVGGDEAKGSPMSDGIKSQIPIQLDAMYRVNKDLAAGMYFSYGIGQLASDFCTDGASCSANVIRVGVQGTYAFNDVKAPLVPWVGAGIGWERLGLSAEAGGQKIEGNDTGVELNLQVGGDYKVNDQFSVGPYLMVSFGQYTSAEIKTPAGTVSGSISDTAMHEWFGFGVRGKFDL